MSADNAVVERTKTIAAAGVSGGETIDVITRAVILPKTTTTTNVTTESVLSNDITVPTRVAERSKSDHDEEERPPNNYSKLDTSQTNTTGLDIHGSTAGQDFHVVSKGEDNSIEPLNSIVIPDTTNFLPINSNEGGSDIIEEDKIIPEETSADSDNIAHNNSNIDTENRTASSTGNVLQIRPSTKPNKTLKFAFSNDLNSKRSSIYASKSTTKAIPIRNQQKFSNNRTYPNLHFEQDDIASLKSRSSSMTASLSKGFLFGFYNNKKKESTTQKSVLSKEYWMKDESAKECFTCGKTFNTFRRKHHCRICGQIFCKNCTLIISGERFGYDQNLRVCQTCYNHADSYEDSSDDEYFGDDTTHTIKESSTALHSESPIRDQSDISNDHDIDLEQSDNVNFDSASHHNEVLLIHDDDVHSIITAKQDSKLFISTPPPPPKMAIPATKQGGSLEISLKGNRSKSGIKDTLSYENVNEKFNIRQVNSPKVHRSNERRNTQSSQSLRRSIFQYIGKSNKPLENEDDTPKSVNKLQINNNPTLLSNKNFQFKFNFHAPANSIGRNPSSGLEVTDQLSSSSGNTVANAKYDSDDDGSNDNEDEASMSLYSLLHGSNNSTNPVGSLRTSSKSNQRAEASLQRIRHKRTGKSKSISMTNPGNRGLDFLNSSTPNLLSVVSDDLPTSQSAIFSTRVASEKPVSTAWKRLSSITSAKYNHETKSELTDVAQLHLKSLLEQVINDQDIENKDIWKEVLLVFFLRMQCINLSAKELNTLDYRQNYMKIKRIPGGHITSSEYVNGIVFSKNLPNKCMPRKIENPRVLLLMFPIEYERNENKFLSIESVMAQEKEYLDKLVSRIISLRPDIIYVGANVSGYALELFIQAGIVIQFNMKPQVLERIAKYTDADIALSIEKLATNMKMGECQLFELKSYIYERKISKTYTFIRGCDPVLGGTIVLRGDNEINLRKVKQIVEFMVYATFSLKLESSFFSDNFIKLSVEQYILDKQELRNKKVDGYFSDFLEKFNSRLLSVSPTVAFPLPYLLRRARNLERELRLLEDTTSTVHIAKEELHKNLLSDISNKLTKNDLANLTQFIMNRENRDLEYEYLKRARQWEVYYSLTRNMLGTGSHQSISVLYSMVSKSNATPCFGPQLVTIDYFWDNDISVGQFIENIVMTAWHPCKQGCNGLLFDHYRSYVHGEGKVDVLLEKFETKLPKLRDIILTWSYCKKCGSSTPILQLSEKTWNYSLGKYLEIMFWSKKHSLLGIGKCGHEFTKDHVKYFSFNELVVRLEYSDLEIHELITPPRKIRWKPNRDIIMKVELYYGILDKINAFYTAVSDRLNRIKLDGVSEDILDSGKRKLGEMKERMTSNRKQLLMDLDVLYNNSPGDKHLHLNSILRAIYNQTVSWNNEFREFGETYLPSENDISRITTTQLKKIFGDSSKKNTTAELDDQNKVVTVASDAALNHEKSSDNLDEESQISEDNNEIINNMKNIREMTMKPSFSTSLINGPKIRGNLLIEHSVPPAPLKNEPDDNRVGKLASFFDQLHYDALTKEFELQRELQKLQMNKNKSRKLRLQNSTPIVEIYKNVKDAVDEPLHDKNSGKVNAESKDNDRDTVKEDKITGALKKVPEILEAELENSINRWGEAYIKGSGPSVSDIEHDNSSPMESNEKNNRKDGNDIGGAGDQVENTTLIRTLTNFWADRSAYLWKPFAFPISANEHVFTDSDVIIREDEPSSLVAFCLSTTDYKQKMISLDSATNARLEKTSADSDLQNSISTKLSDKNGFNEMFQKTSNFITNKQSEEATEYSSQNVNPGELLQELEAVMTKKTAIHLRYQFEDGLVVMSCKVFFAEHFEAFRKICNCDENFIQSLSRCVKWNFSGGKSGSGFLKTLDNRFIIKELSHSEVDAFIKFTPSYFEYMTQAMFHDLPTTLAKVFGFYQIQVKSPISGSKNYKMNVIIMENLFYNKKTTRIFDLKGSMRNRHVEQTGKANEVLLDENMVEYIYESPIYVREYDKKLLRASLWNDTLFLAKMNVMDYSLVIGINNDDYTLTVGIIDFIRTFTWDKKLESWVKEKGLVGGGTTVMKQPTVVTPKQYKNRFREAMERYILMVPDPWFQENN